MRVKGRVSLKLVFILLVVVASFLLVGLITGYSPGLEGTITLTTPTTTPTSNITTIQVSIGEIVATDTWKLTVLEVTETRVAEAIGYLQAKKGYKIIVVKVRIENIGLGRGVPFSIYSIYPDPGQLSHPVLITDTGKVYYLYDYSGLISSLNLKGLERIEVPTKEVVESALNIEYFSFFAIVEKGGYKEGHIWTVIPESERPLKLTITYYPPLYKPLLRIEVIILPSA